MINLDNDQVKYGITNNISKLINEEYNNYVKLRIIKIIVLEENVNKNYIKSNEMLLYCNLDDNKLFKLDDLDYYLMELYKYIQKISDNYYELRYEEIEELYNKSIKKERLISRENGYKQQYYKKICLRCGKIFKERSSLNSHFKRKKICNAIYMDILYSEMINNYNINYNDYYMNYLYTSDILQSNMEKFCYRCGKSFLTKSNLNRHLSIKKSCEEKYLGISRNEIMNNYNIFYTEFIKKKFELNNNLEINENLIHNFVCELCEKKFINKSNYSRHKNKYCKILKKSNQENELFEEYLDKKYKILKLEHEEKLEKKTDELKKTNEELKIIIDDEKNKIKEELQSKINELEGKIQQITLYQNNNQNTDNNTIINQNIENIINNYGEEDLSKIGFEEWNKIAASEFEMIQNMVKLIHIDIKENRNIFIPSTKEKYAMILQNQKWLLVNKSEFIEKLIKEKSILFKKILDKYSDKFNDKHRLKSILKLCINDPEEIKKIINDTILMLCNSGELIKNTYELIYNKKIKSR